MTKYMLKEPDDVGDTMRFPGEVFEIKRLKHSVKLRGMKETFKFIVVGEDELLSKKSLKARFTKGTYKSETPKHIFKTLLIIALYELSKAITYELVVRKQANDIVEQSGYDEIDAWKKY